jgi:hypothetical protein
VVSGPSRPGAGRRPALEALTAGVAYSAGLCGASVCLVASFRPRGLSLPYWRDVPGLRTDTCGIASFFALAVCFGISEYLRLCRRQDRQARPRRASSRGRTTLLAMAVSETVALLASALVVYLSLNAVTHPATLGMRATHLAGWPTEGTLRVSALFLCACAVAVLRYLCVRSHEE